MGAIDHKPHIKLSDHPRLSVRTSDGCYAVMFVPHGSILCKSRVLQTRNKSCLLDIIWPTFEILRDHYRKHSPYICSFFMATEIFGAAEMNMYVQAA